MTEVGSTTQVKRKWYNNYHFPLIPNLTIREGDEHNTSSWSFTWLFIKLWSLDSCSLEVGIVLDSHWGIGVIGILPYLRWVVCIPCPTGLMMWTQKYLWRKPKSKVNNYNYSNA